ADPGRAKIARLGDLAVEAEIAPHRPTKNPLLFTGIYFGVVIKAVGHPAVIERGPNRSGHHRHIGLWVSHADGASSAGPFVLVILALATADTQLRVERGASRLQLGMSVERRLVGPTFEQNQLVRVERTLENLELFAAGFLHALLATRPVRLRELGPFSRCGRNRDDEPNCHNPSHAWVRTQAVRSRDNAVKDGRGALSGCRGRLSSGSCSGLILAIEQPHGSPPDGTPSFSDGRRTLARSSS